MISTGAEIRLASENVRYRLNKSMKGEHKGNLLLGASILRDREDCCLSKYSDEVRFLWL